MLKNLTVNSEENYHINKKSVHSVVGRVKKELGFSISFLQINFVSSQYIKKLNAEYLRHKGSTDIITFNYSGDNEILDGECFISVEDAGENAKKYKVSFDNELIRLIVHGILHLVGFDDIEKKDKLRMKEEENRLVELIDDSVTKMIGGYDK